jgi:fumarate hydratase class I
VLELTRKLGIGAQFGGKYFCHDVRVIRLPRHGASLPVAIAVSCSADRQCLGKITARRRVHRAAGVRAGQYLPESVDATSTATWRATGRQGRRWSRST